MKQMTAAACMPWADRSMLFPPYVGPVELKSTSTVGNSTDANSRSAARQRGPFSIGERKSHLVSGCTSSIGKGVKILFVPTLLHPLFMQVLVVAAFTLHWVNTFFSMRRSLLMPNNAII